MSHRFQKPYDETCYIYIYNAHKHGKHFMIILRIYASGTFIFVIRDGNKRCFEGEIII